MNATTIVCVTGGNGFVGSHCVARLLEQGYTVRTTVRSLDPAKTDPLRKAVPNASRLSFHKADLLHDAGWQEVLTGCTYVLHVASPLVMSEPKDENELIRPAVEGTTRVLEFAAAAGVKRVVLTSSYLAVGAGHKDYTRVHDESVWSDEAGLGSVGAYTKSKIRAERAAWTFADRHPELELTVMNPHLVLGPLLIKGARSSLAMIEQMQNGKLPIAPKIQVGAVDVRDVAACHVIAMTLPEANGQRYILAAGEDMQAKGYTLQEIGAMLGKRIRTMPDGLVRVLAYVSADVKMISLDLGVTRRISTAKATNAFGYKFRSVQEAVKASADSLNV
jgi:dihydroflavonol-4-reductase